MDIQYHGGNCITLNAKGVRVVIDDTLAALGLKAVVKQGDVALFTGEHQGLQTELRLLVDTPGEYEVSDLSIVGVAARAHMDEPGTSKATIYKVMADDTTYLFVGNIYPQLNDEQLEAIGMIDVMVLPIGGNGYTLDASGALQLIKTIEPKVVIPTHYADPVLQYPVEQQSLEMALKNLAMEPQPAVSRYRFKPTEIGATTQLQMLTRV